MAHSIRLAKQTTFKNRRISNIGSAIMELAKAIRKKNPSKKWTACVSQAAKALKK